MTLIDNLKTFMLKINKKEQEQKESLIEHINELLKRGITRISAEIIESQGLNNQYPEIIEIDDLENELLNGNMTEVEKLETIEKLKVVEKNAMVKYGLKPTYNT